MEQNCLMLCVLMDYIQVRLAILTTMLEVPVSVEYKQLTRDLANLSFTCHTRNLNFNPDVFQNKKVQFTGNLKHGLSLCILIQMVKRVSSIYNRLVHWLTFETQNIIYIVYIDVESLTYTCSTDCTQILVEQPSSGYSTRHAYQGNATR